MSDETPAETPETPAPEENTPETPGEEVPPTPEAEKPKEEEKPALTPEAALAEVEKTRGEAARYRTRAREAEKKLAEAKTLEEVNEIVANMTADREKAERALLIENVALKHALPETLAARLQGTTRDELEADAKALAAFAATPVKKETPPRLRGGLTPDQPGGDDDLSPRDLAKKYGRGRRNR